MCCFIHGHNVFWRTDRLNIVTRGEYVSVLLVENVDVVKHFSFDFIDCAKGEGVLVVDTSVEDELLAEVFHECFTVHTMAAPLDGVEHINAEVDHVGDDVVDGAVAVKEDKYARIVCQVDHAFHAG